MTAFLLRLRIVGVAIVALLLVHSLALLVIGGVRAFQAYEVMVRPSGWSGAERPGLHILESVDSLLLSLVLFVLAVGVGTLFASRHDQDATSHLPEWMRFKNLSELKHTLWEAVLVAMVVAGVTSMVGNLEHLTWNELIIPSAVLILSASLAIVKRFGH